MTSPRRAEIEKMRKKVKFYLNFDQKFVLPWPVPLKIREKHNLPPIIPYCEVNNAK